MNIKWLYIRDFEKQDVLYRVAEYWLQRGYRVFVQGSSFWDCKEVT